MKLKNFKALMRDRKGVAIELAIAVMLITLAVSTILISTAVHNNSHRTTALADFEKKIAFYQEFESEVRGNNPMKDQDGRVNVVKNGKAVCISIDGNASLIIDDNLKIVPLEITTDPN